MLYPNSNVFLGPLAQVITSVDVQLPALPGIKLNSDSNYRSCKTNPNDAEASAAGRSVRACVAHKSLKLKEKMCKELEVYDLRIPLKWKLS